MSIDWQFFRDEILIGPAFAAELMAETKFRGLPMGSTLLIAGRRVVHEPNFVLRIHGLNVIVFAQTYDCKGGCIDVSGSNGKEGSTGTNGREGYASAAGANNRPGGRGGDGGYGLAGTAGMSLKLICHDQDQACLKSVGGSGGSGGAGGAGGHGGNGNRGNPPHFEGFEGTSGGDGGNGGAGGQGGPAGQLVDFYVQVGHSTPTLAAYGGSGGSGGSAGGGGAKGKESDDALNGKEGRAGSPASAGRDTIVETRSVTENEYWTHLRGEGIASIKWGEYRRRVGKYYFRAFNPLIPETINYLQLASNEFIAAINLIPGDSESRALLDQVNHNQNILGLARDFDLIADFSRYERVAIDYAPMIMGVLEVATDILRMAYDVAGNKERLTSQIPHAQTSTQIFSLERDAAALAYTSCALNLDVANAELRTLGAEIEANRAALEQWNMELEARRIQSVAKVCAAIIAVIGAAYSGGTSLAAVPGLLIGAQDAWKEFRYDAATKTVVYQGQGIATWFTWDNGKPKLKPEVANLIKGVEDVVKKVIDIVDKVKVLTEIDASTVNGQLVSKGKDLMKKTAELSFKRADANLRLKQADLLGQALDLRIKQSLEDVETIRNQEASMQADVRFLGETARILVDTAQKYMDIVTKYVFFAARSLEIFTFSDYAYPVSLDYGHIHPDLEEAAYLALSRGDSTRVLALLRSYSLSWGRVPSIIAYRDRYESYRMNLTSDLQFWLFDDAAEIQEFVEGGTFSFDLRLDDLLPARFDAKIEAVFVALVGAASDEPRITCILEHAGDASVQKPDGSVLTVSAPPRQVPVAAGKLLGDLGGLGSGSRSPFWGRSPAARWRLRIEPEVVTRGHVDLTNLNAVQVAVSYQSL